MRLLVNWFGADGWNLEFWKLEMKGTETVGVTVTNCSR